MKNILFKVQKNDAQKALDIAYNLSDKGYNIYASNEVANHFNKNFVATNVCNNENIEFEFIITTTA